ncbi:hypothetical protein N9231_03755 [Saprospiraceae bacterium]|nr:hypothetical protein [Saprospiraceae bacterium]
MTAFLYVSRMFRRLFISFAIVIAVGMFCTQLRAQNSSVELAAGEQLVILKNGNVVNGFVERTPSGVTVQTRQGSRLIIAADQTDFVCDSLEQAYWGKQARTRATDLERQIQLFKWCLQQNLLGLAQNQIDILQLSSIKATRLENLNRQLQVGFRQQKKSREKMAMAQVESKPVNSSSVITVESKDPNRDVVVDQDPRVPSAAFFEQLDPVFSPLPSLTDGLAKTELPNENGVIFKTIRSPEDPEPSEIVQVGFENPIESPRASDVASAVQPVSLAELDKTTRSMPKGSLAVFRQQIENVMIGRCSNCHDAKSAVMPLMHAGKRQLISRRMSQRNLHSILGFVDRQHPRSSPILAAASTAHGGTETASIEIDSKPYNNLLKWLILISDQPNQVVIPIEPPPDDALKIDIQSIKPLKPDSAAPMNPKAAPESNLELPPAIGEIPKLNSQNPRFTPRDEFDPEIFNREHIDRID